MKERLGDSRTTIPCDPDSYSEVCMGGGRLFGLFVQSLFFEVLYGIEDCCLPTICRVKTKE